MNAAFGLTGIHGVVDAPNCGQVSLFQYAESVDKELKKIPCPSVDVDAEEKAVRCDLRNGYRPIREKTLGRPVLRAMKSWSWSGMLDSKGAKHVRALSSAVRAGDS